jgi:small conductance mechanosensitive channel
MFESLFATIITTLTSGILGVVFTAVVCLLVARYLTKFLETAIDRSPIETTIASFLKPVLRVVIYFIAGLMIADKLGFDVTSIVAFASVLSAAFALAAQGALSNLFGGILMLFTKPFVVGDYVIAGGVEGTVQEISLFNTVLTTIDNKRVTIPNGTISAGTITNCSTEGKRRVDLEISASYDAPVEKVKDSIQEAIAATEGTLSEPAEPFVRLYKYGDSAITYIVRVWSNNADYWNVYFDLLENIKVYFDKNGVEMTYNHMIVHQAD